MIRTLYITLLFSITLVNTVYAANSTPLISLAHSYSVAGNHHESFDTYWLAFRQAPENIEINYNLGLEAIAIADYESAVMAFERVLLLDPQATQAKIELAKAFHQLGAIKTAQQYFREVLTATDLPAESKRNIESFLQSHNQ